MKKPEVPDFVPEYLSDPTRIEIHSPVPEFTEKEYGDGVIVVLQDGIDGGIVTEFPDGGVHYDYGNEKAPKYYPPPT